MIFQFSRKKRQGDIVFSMEYHVYWLLKSCCFGIFRDAKYGFLLSQKVDGNMIFTDYWNVLVLKFSEMGNTVFFLAKELMERWYFLITEKFIFWTFPWWEIRSFLSQKVDEKWYLQITAKFLFWSFWWWQIRSVVSQKVDGKMIFTWSFWGFHDILGLGKYGFSCNESWCLNDRIVYLHNFYEYSFAPKPTNSSIISPFNSSFILPIPFLFSSL